MFFSCQLAFDAGERGGDLAPPRACDGPTQVFRTTPCCRLKLWTSFVKCCQLQLWSEKKKKKKALFAFAVFVKWNFILIQFDPRQLIYMTRLSQNRTDG